MIADIYSHMLYQLSYAEPAWQMDTEGFEPSTSRMRNGRSSTELSALFSPDNAHNAAKSDAIVPKWSWGWT